MANWFLLLLLHPGLPIRILTFDASSDGEIAHQIYDKSTPLPELFTLCSAFKESVMYQGGNSFFTLYGEDGKPWMILTTWIGVHIELWLRINQYWVEITEIPAHMMHSWIHVCIMANTVTGNISVVINEGPPLVFAVPELTTQTPLNLKGKLFIGKSEDFEGANQFKGEVANFNIFTGFRVRCRKHPKGV